MMIDLDALVRAVRTVAAGRPGHVYERNHDRKERGCDYVRDGQPSCLIAQAAARIGMNIESLEEWDARPDSSIHEILVTHYGLDPDNPRVTWLSIVQRSQDSERSWADAIAKADNVFPRPIGIAG